MCGYLRRTYGETRYTDFLKPFGLGGVFAGVKERPNETEHFKPAHAQHGEFKIRDIIIQ